MTPAIDVVILTEDRYVMLDAGDAYQCNIRTEETLIADALRASGLTVARHSWSDATIDWGAVGCALFRSTWDYFHRFAEFSRWLTHVSARTQLFNPAPLLRWNIDKHYLAELAAKGVAVVPTAFVEKGDATPLDAVLTRHGWHEAVFKPVVSGAARLTYRVDRATVAAHASIFADCVAAEAMIVQRFEPAIVNTGELSLMVIDGHTTHAVRKIAKAGDFRVQDDHGGTVHPHTPSAAERAFAEAAVRACPMMPLYARVDFVRSAAGDYRLMELELVEPELFFRFHPPAAKALAKAMVQRLR